MQLPRLKSRRHDRSGPWLQRRLRMMRRRALFADHTQILAILALRQSLDDLLQLLPIDEAHPKRHLLEARDLQALAMFDRGDVIAGFEEIGRASCRERV